MLPSFELKTQEYDVVLQNNDLNEKVIDELLAEQTKLKPFIEKIESIKTGGHLTGIAESIYVFYKKIEIMIKAGSLLKEDLIESFVVYEILDHLRRLDCHRTNTFARFKDIKLKYEQI